MDPKRPPIDPVLKDLIKDLLPPPPSPALKGRDKDARPRPHTIAHMGSANLKRNAIK